MDWVQESYQYRKIIRIDSTLVEGTHTDFPVVISIQDDTQLYNHARSDGYDIIFTNSNGDILNHQIHSFTRNVGDGNVDLVVWVQVDTLYDTEDTILLMYYGKPSQDTPTETINTWSNGFIRIWHLEESGIGTTDEYKDSSGNNINGIGGAGAPTQTPARVVGKIGYGQQFDGSNDWIQFLDTFDPTTYTISAWVKPTDITSTNIVVRSTSDPTVSWSGQLRITSDSKFEHHIRTTIHEIATGTTTVIAENWYYVAGTHLNNDLIRIFVNGIQEDTEAVGIISTAENRYLVGRSTGDGMGYFSGIIDEIRISSVVRSANWILTEYNNQNNLTIGNFIEDIGPEQERPFSSSSSSLSSSSSSSSSSSRSSSSSSSSSKSSSSSSSSSRSSSSSSSRSSSSSSSRSSSSSSSKSSSSSSSSSLSSSSSSLSSVLSSSSSSRSSSSSSSSSSSQSSSSSKSSSSSRSSSRSSSSSKSSSSSVLSSSSSSSLQQVGVLPYELPVTEVNEKTTVTAWVSFRNESGSPVRPDSVSYIVYDKFSGQIRRQETITVGLLPSIYVNLTSDTNIIYNQLNRYEIAVLVVTYMYNTDKIGKIVKEYKIRNLLSVIGGSSSSSSSSLSSSSSQSSSSSSSSSQSSSSSSSSSQSSFSSSSSSQSSSSSSQSSSSSSLSSSSSS